jgi:hypothetical protein
MKFRLRITASVYLTLLVASGLLAQQTNTGDADSTLTTVSSANAGLPNANTGPHVANPAKGSWVRQADEFVPMTRSERGAQYAYSLFGPQAFLYSAVQAGFSQLSNSPEEWRRGAEGYGKRYGSAFAQHFIATTIGNTIAFGLHEDNRYFKSGKTGMGRLGYAITSSFLARHDDGSRFISFSQIGGTAAGAFISRTWQPPSTGSMGSGAVSFGIGIGVRAALNVAREFLPARLATLVK